ncbi:hypothetical protein C8R47DRAFT_1169594 [Mycena vitilis]|nr:hypothetical protein C8R47DRAFT_1169594 [Mycena vitilis]
MTELRRCICGASLHLCHPIQALPPLSARRQPSRLPTARPMRTAVVNLAELLGAVPFTVFFLIGCMFQQHLRGGKVPYSSSDCRSPESTSLRCSNYPILFFPIFILHALLNRSTRQNTRLANLPFNETIWCVRPTSATCFPLSLFHHAPPIGSVRRLLTARGSFSFQGVHQYK